MINQKKSKLAFNTILITIILLSSFHSSYSQFQPEETGAEQSRITTFYRPNYNLINQVLKSKQDQYDKRMIDIDNFNRCVNETHKELSKFKYFEPVLDGFHNVKVMGEGICGYSSVWVKNNYVTEYWIPGESYRVVKSDYINNETYYVTFSVVFHDGSSVPLRAYFYENFKK